MNDKKYIILVLSCKNPPFDLIEQAQRQTWAAEPDPPEIETLFYYADPNNKEAITVDNDKIIIKSEDGLMDLYKTLVTIEYVLEKYKNTTHIFLTNSSSYIVKKKILHVFSCLPALCAYSGELSHPLPHPIHKEIFRYASGAGFFMSKDLCIDILNNRHLFPNPCYGDLEFGYYFHKKNIFATPQPRLNLCQWNLDQIMNISYNHIRPHFQIRCKQWSNRTNDCIVMKLIHTIIKKFEYQ